MIDKGILIDYEYCSGCQTCMMACQVERKLPIGRYGIVVNTVGPWAIDKENDVWQYDYIPTLTDECDLCESRVAKGKLPSCVMHCQAAVMKYGDLETLLAEMQKKHKQIVQIPKCD